MATLQYGLNFPASNVKQILEQNNKQQSGVRSWRQLFGGASLGFNAQSDALTTDYSSAMAQAYKSNFEKNQSIIGGGLSEGYTREMLSMSRQELANTYDTYIRNYASDLNTAAKSYTSEVSAIDEALTKRSGDYAKYLNYAWQYGSEELYGSRLGESETDYFVDKGLNWMLSDTGELKSWDEISQLLVDESGALTDKGRAYFDAMYNASPQKYITVNNQEARSFEKWLSDIDPELREQMLGQDVFNYTFAGTNKGTLNTMLGRESIDQAYDRPEYDLLLNATDKGYEQFTSKIQDAVWNTLENKNREGIKSISEIGSRVKKDTYHAPFGGTKTYDEWFKFAEEKISKAFLGSTMLAGDVGAIRSALTGYVNDYKRYAKSEYETFKSELKNLVGEALGQEFLREYAGETERLYTQLQNTSSDSTAIDSGLIARVSSDAESALELAKSVRDMGFDKAMRGLYKDLQIFIDRKRTEIESERANVSGF